MNSGHKDRNNSDKDRNWSKVTKPKVNLGSLFYPYRGDILKVVSGKASEFYL